MFAKRFALLKKDRKIRRIIAKDTVSDDVKKVLEDVDQKLILMVRG